MNQLVFLCCRSFMFLFLNPLVLKPCSNLPYKALCWPIRLPIAVMALQRGSVSKKSADGQFKDTIHTFEWIPNTRLHPTSHVLLLRENLMLVDSSLMPADPLSQ